MSQDHLNALAMLSMETLQHPPGGAGVVATAMQRAIWAILLKMLPPQHRPREAEDKPLT